MVTVHPIFDFAGLFSWFKRADMSLRLMAIGMLLLLPLLKWMPMFIMVTFLLLVREKFTRGEQLLNCRFSVIGMGMLVFFAAYVLGLLWTENDNLGWRNIEYKLSFILLPFFFNQFSHFVEVRRWIQIFILGLFINSFLLVGFASYRTLTADEADIWKFWQESEFSFFLHRSYLAAYMSIGALLMIGLFLKLRKITLLFLFFLFTLMIVLSASKAGLIVLLLGSFLIVLRYAINNFRSRRIRLFSVLFVLSLFLTVLLSEVVRIRFQSAWKALFTAEVVNNKSKDSTEARVMMWSASWELIQRHFWLGLGTGDVDDELQKINIARNNQGVVQQKLNSHNQFLTIFLQLGVFGFIFFILGLLYLFQFYWKQRSAFGVVILFVFVINFFFESFLETRAGLFPFCWLILSTTSFVGEGTKNIHHEISVV